jgi:hypothetical protein
VELDYRRKPANPRHPNLRRYRRRPDGQTYYRRSALRECDSYIEIWSEKEALSGIIWEAASDYHVPVVVSKGMPSLT